MTGKNLNIVPPNKGEVITADFLMQLSSGVNRMSRFFEGPAIANGAGVFRRKTGKEVQSGTRREVFKLDADFHRKSADVMGQIMRWSSDSKSFTTPTDVRHTLKGDFYRGYSFEGDLLLAERIAGNWFAQGQGYRWLKGTLDGDLSSGGTQTITLTLASGQTVTATESVGLDSSLSSGAVLWVTWYDGVDDNSGFWLAALSPC